MVFNIQKVILLIGFALLSFSVLGQGGNLQFGRVINFSVPAQNVTTIENGSPALSIPVSIPANKVWKIESCGSNENEYWTIRINDYNLSVGSAYSSTTNTSSFPIWIPSGLYNLKAVSKFSNSVQYFFGASLSIIEFNIVN